MAELILLCEGAAAERGDPAAADAFDDAANAIGKQVSSDWLGRCLAGGCLVSDSRDDTPIARESPADTWLRDRMRVAESDAIQAYAAFAEDSDAPAPRWSLKPTNVQVGFDHLRLADPAQLALDEAEARELAEAIAPLFAQAGYRLHCPTASCWFFVAEHEPRIDAHPWTMACGRSIEAYMPSGPDARAWRKLLTEVQMHWHEHRINARREDAGRSTVNMLWLDGRAGAALPRSFDVIATANAALAGLARRAASRLIDTAGGPPALGRLAPAAPAADVLVDVGLWREARRCGDTRGWASAWNELDAWLAALGEPAAVRARFARVRAVLTGERRRVEMSSDGAGWTRIWRRFDPVAAVL